MQYRLVQTIGWTYTVLQPDCDAVYEHSFIGIVKKRKQVKPQTTADTALLLFFFKELSNVRTFFF